MSARPVTTAADPVVSGLQRLDRWQRGRALTLAGLELLGVSLLTQLEIPRPLEEPDPVPALAAATPVPPPTEPVQVPVCGWDESGWTVEPRLEQRDGAWLGRDVLGTSTIEIDDADPTRAQATAREWARSICDPSPRLLYLVGFEDPAARESLIATLETECPSLTVRFTELVPTRCFGKYFDAEALARPPAVARH